MHNNNNKDLDDNGKLHQKYVNKRVNAGKEGISFELSFDEYCQLVRDAGLKSSDLGFTGEQPVMSLELLNQDVERLKGNL